jgi:hypothetical protein
VLPTNMAFAMIAAALLLVSILALLSSELR